MPPDHLRRSSIVHCALEGHGYDVVDIQDWWEIWRGGDLRPLGFDIIPIGARAMFRPHDVPPMH